DLVEDHPSIEWVGNWSVNRLCGHTTKKLMCGSNELNASYAADGYARVNNTVGVVLTTYVSNRIYAPSAA
ncbi:hypothetical protein C0989_007943, partial [Termitomyces sp. Mn162]